MYSALHQVFIKVHVLLTTLNSQLTPGNEMYLFGARTKTMKLSISSIQKSVFMLVIIHFSPTPSVSLFSRFCHDRLTMGVAAAASCRFGANPRNPPATGSPRPPQIWARQKTPSSSHPSRSHPFSSSDHLHQYQCLQQRGVLERLFISSSGAFDTLRQS